MTPQDVQRGNHAHKNLEQVIICTSGVLVINLENKSGNKLTFTLDSPDMGLYISSGYWRTLDFSKNTVLLCLASQSYEEDDYIRDYDVFKKK